MLIEINGRNKEGPIHLTMNVDNQFDCSGMWLKGNLHCHPKDHRDPKGLCDRYLKMGFDVLASTDYYFVEQTKLSSYGDALVVLNGTEMAGMDSLSLAHLICVGIDEIPRQYGGCVKRIRECVDDTNKQGGLVFVAHPYWSGLTADVVARLAEAGVVGFEVSNRLCWTINGKERSDVIWHELFDRGCYLAAVGCDDWHVSAGNDVLGKTWTGVLADARSAEAVMDGIRAARTYASEGPEIRNIRFTKTGRVIAECSPCVACHFVSAGYGVRTMRAGDVSESFEVDLAVDGYRLENWLCVCVEDQRGRRAWSSAIRVSNTITRLY